jgi:hypothetical protein
VFSIPSSFASLAASTQSPFEKMKRVGIANVRSLFNLDFEGNARGLYRLRKRLESKGFARWGLNTGVIKTALEVARFCHRRGQGEPHFRCQTDMMANVCQFNREKLSCLAHLAGY